jgi:hypothetical protein
MDYNEDIKESESRYEIFEGDFCSTGRYRGLFSGPGDSGL